MTNIIGMLIELFVAVLLMLTIGYCVLLNRRLKLLKADERSLRGTICELVRATELAERAIAGLKLTVEECENGLATRLASAEHFSADLDRGIAAGGEVLERLAQITTPGSAAGGGSGSLRQHQPKAPRQDAQAVAKAAQAFAERLRVKARGLAA